MTEYVQVDPQAPDPRVLERAAEVLRGGGIVAFPTETVYGLGASAASEEAVERLRHIKGRPEEKPFAYLLPDPERVAALVPDISSRAQALMNRYWPGPLTLILPTGDGEETGVRVPAHPVARELLRRAGVFVLSSSANPSGEAPATDTEAVRAYFDGRIDLLVDGGPATLAEASTVVRVTAERSEILREGIITAENVHQLLAGRTILFVCTGNTCRSPMAAALFRKRLAAKLDRAEDELEELGYRITSAGIYASYGSRASEGAVQALAAKGCDLSRHVSRPLSPELVREADRIYAMTPSHLDALRQIEPAAAQRAELLTEETIPDPAGGSPETYRQCAERIEAAVLQLIERF